jgi:signal transduction histidine kinase
MPPRAMPRRPPARSLYFKLLQLGLVLVLLPSVLLGVAWIYEHFATRAQSERLERIPLMVDAALDSVSPETVARREGVVVAWLDARGANRPPHRLRAARALRDRGGGREDRGRARRPDSWITRTRSCRPGRARDEVRAALGGVRSFGRHLTPDGIGAAADAGRTAPRRRHAVCADGVVSRHPAADAGAQAAAGAGGLGDRAALPIVVLFAVGLVRPLNRLAAAARRYPAAPLADPVLYARRDEIGALARTLSDPGGGSRRPPPRRRRAGRGHRPRVQESAGDHLRLRGAAGHVAGADAERVDLVARSIGESVERLRRSIDDLMALLKLEHAIAAEAREPTAMSAFLETLADEYRRDPRASGWTFTVDVTPEAAAAAPVINRRRWQEMLRNLVDNALVQPATDRRIVLGARLEKRWLVTSVPRRGARHLAREPEQDLPPLLHPAPAGRAAGTGLGLSIVESVARAHAARVDVESQVGQGATFRVSLPL